MDPSLILSAFVLAVFAAGCGGLVASSHEASADGGDAGAPTDRTGEIGTSPTSEAGGAEDAAIDDDAFAPADTGPTIPAGYDRCSNHEESLPAATGACAPPDAVDETLCAFPGLASACDDFPEACAQGDPHADDDTIAWLDRTLVACGGEGALFAVTLSSHGCVTKVDWRAMSPATTRCFVGTIARVRFACESIAVAARFVGGAPCPPSGSSTPASLP